jgi:hypothetical protein
MIAGISNPDFATTLKRSLAVFRTAALGVKPSAADKEKKRRPELEQALLRVLIGFIVMVYLFWYALRDGSPALRTTEIQVLAVSVAFFVFGVCLAVHILQKGGTSVPRRYLAMVADNVVTTYCLMNMGEGGAVVIGVYLFVTFGNGFRYGRTYLFVGPNLLQFLVTARRYRHRFFDRITNTTAVRWRAGGSH